MIKLGTSVSETFVCLLRGEPGSDVVAVAAVGLDNPKEVLVLSEELGARGLVTLVKKPRVVAQVEALAFVVNFLVVPYARFKGIIKLNLPHQQLEVVMGYGNVKF